jgi:hypothetical protein
MDKVSEPALGSDRQYENIAPSLAILVKYVRFMSSDPARINGIVPSLLTAGISDDDWPPDCGRERVLVIDQ